MASESEICVDELMLKLRRIDTLLEKFETSQSDELVTESRGAAAGMQSFLDENRPVIPSFCLKKAVDALNKLEFKMNTPQKSRLLFKFKSKASDSQQESRKSDQIEDNSRTAEPPAQAREPLQSEPFFGVRDKANETFRLEGNEVKNRDVSLLNLTKCTVIINGSAGTVYIRNLMDCNVTVCLSSRAITIANCTNCKFSVICQQLRIDSTSNCRFRTLLSARAMLESSKGLEFGPLNSNNVPGIMQEKFEDLLKESEFDATKNNWKCIDDFDWLSTDRPSENYRLLE